MSHHAKTITDFDAIIFDMDGLLLDTEKLSYQSFISAAAAYGLTFQFDDYRQLIGRNAKQVLKFCAAHYQPVLTR